MGEVADIRKHREIEICKGLAEPVGPFIGKQRIMLGPANTGRHAIDGSTGASPFIILTRPAWAAR